MKSCGNQRSGKPKIGHLTKEEAIAHLENAQKRTNHLMNVYRCPKCKLWHVGRKPAGRKYHARHKAERGREEYLVGKLVAALRGKS